jgi:3-oxoacyl-[acyl-carrier protein] reductase
LKQEPLLRGKSAVIFGAAGGVGSATAKEFAAQGAQVFLSGRTLPAVEALAEEIKDEGGIAFAAGVDALDERAVYEYVETVAMQAGIDIVLNVTGPRPSDYRNGTPVLELAPEQFSIPLTKLVVSQYITARSAARVMERQHSGVILFVTAVPSRLGTNTASIGAAFGAMESLLRCLAAELGPSGVRVVGIRSGPLVDTKTIQWSYETIAKRTGMTTSQVASMLQEDSLVKVSSSAADVAKVAAFLASDAARTITGAIVNANSGRVVD